MEPARVRPGMTPHLGGHRDYVDRSGVNIYT
jgi:hypothetical protein